MTAFGGIAAESVLDALHGNTTPQAMPKIGMKTMGSNAVMYTGITCVKRLGGH